VSKLEELAAAYKRVANHEKSMEAHLAVLQNTVPYNYDKTWKFIAGELNASHVDERRAAAKLLEHIRSSI
jgi:hypothetical protein